MPRLATRHGFTLIELLVVISIIGLLISLLLPALTAARQSARMVTCLSQLRQIGLATHMYANEHEDVFPSYWYNETSTGGGDPEKEVWTGPLKPYIGLSKDSTNIGIDIHDVYICTEVDTTYRHVFTGVLQEGRSWWAYEVSNGIFSPAGTWPAPSFWDSVPLKPRRKDYQQIESKVIVMFCNGSSATGANHVDLMTDYPDYLHFDGGNILLADGHAVYSSYTDVVDHTEPISRSTNKMIDTGIAEVKWAFYESY